MDEKIQDVQENNLPKERKKKQQPTKRKKAKL